MIYPIPAEGKIINVVPEFDFCIEGSMTLPGVFYESLMITSPKIGGNLYIAASRVKQKGNCIAREWAESIIRNEIRKMQDSGVYEIAPELMEDDEYSDDW